ncbi:MAG: 50S ribosomal protein L4 [Patescibacteria group bacterium]
MQFTVLNTTGKSTTLEANESVFGAKPNKVLVAQAVRVFLSNQRQGTAKTKTRAEISRTKKKWFKQKGTGNARHGARSANIFVGGGVSHGPTGHENWLLTMAKEMKKKALISALSLQKDQIVVTTVLGDIQPKTKDAVAFLKKLAPNSKKTLIIVDKEMENITRSMANLPRVIITNVQRLNILDVVYADAMIMTKEAVKALEDRLMSKSNKAARSVEVSETKTEVKTETVAVVSEKKPAKKVAAKTVKTAKVEKVVKVEKAAAKPVKKVATKAKKAK